MKLKKRPCQHGKVSYKNELFVQQNNNNTCKPYNT